MRMRKLLRAGAIMALACRVFAGTALAADNAPTSVVSGSMVGDAGGAFETWNVVLSANTDATLTLAHWPCNTGNAVGLEVWGASGLLGMSREKNACTQEISWNTGAGGPAEIKLGNYMSQMATWWTLTASGLTLPGATAPAKAVLVEVKPAVAATTATTVTMSATDASTTSASTTAAKAAPAMAAAAPAVATGLSVDNAVVYGEPGGAYTWYDVQVKKGQSYDVVMQSGSPNGGSWSGTGFELYGPDGLVMSMGTNAKGGASGKFTASSDGKYTIAAYNYHSGVPVFYALQVTEAK